MSRRSELIAGLIAGLALIAIAAVLAVRAYRESPRAQEARSESVACPANAKKANLDFTLNDLNGKPVKLSDFSGKVILLDIWATWCVPCEVELPGFIDLHDKYKSRGAEVVGLVMMDDFSKAKPFAQAHGMTYPILDAVDRADIEAAYGPLDGLPTTFIISRDGRVCATHIGVPQAGKPAASIQKAIENVFDSEIQALL
jgi:peroxiredoxin